MTFRTLGSTLIAIASFAYVSTTIAQDARSAVPDPSGTWTWERNFNGNTMDFSLDLNWDGTKLSGKYTSFGQTAEIEDAKNTEDGLSFVVQREFGGNEFEVQFTGTAEPNDIRGTITIDIDGEPREFDWHAERKQEPIADVFGTWNLRLDTPNGVIEPTLTISLGDDGPQGTYKSMFGELEAKNLKLEDKNLSWEISGDNDQFTFKVNYEGTLDGNSITGTNEYDFNGNTGEMEFTGKKVTDENATDSENESEDDAESEEDSQAARAARRPPMEE